MGHVVTVGRLRLGAGHPLFVIAGPCVIENERHTLMMAERLATITHDLRIPYIFKASFDKANRTSLDSYRGPVWSADFRSWRASKGSSAYPF